MPYTIDNPPERIRKLPKHAQEIFIAAYNAAIEQYEGDEERANRVAWAAVKEQYEQDENGEWHAKKSLKIARREDVSRADVERAVEEYGDVEFADEKNKKYPIDTEEHIRAAWNYINKRKNQAPYSAAEVAAIKRKIIAAWKKKIDKDGPPGAEEKSLADTLIAFGSAVKTLDDGRLGGYLVRFSEAGDYDLVGDRFSATTDFGLGELATLPVMYLHGLDVKLGRRRIGTAHTRTDDVGLWIEAQLKLRDEYEKQIYELARQGKLGWSSGAAAHTVKRVPEGKGALITQWFIAEASLTPIPAEPRNTVVELKSLLTLLNAEDAGKASQEVKSQKSEDTQEVKEMDMQDIIKLLDERDAQKAAALKAAQEAEAARAAQKAEMNEAIKAAVAEALKGVVVPNSAGVKTVNVNTKTTRGFADDAVKGFCHWVITGRKNEALIPAGVSEDDWKDPAFKAAMQGQTDSEGGYAVPDDFYNRIVAKRNETSVVRRMGIVSIPTSLDRILVPAEGTSATKFVVVAEEGTYDENEPTLAQVVITVHKLTKLIKISEELEADAKADFSGWLASVWGRAQALAENYYLVASGTGTGQPQAMLVGATAGITAASATAITAAELLDLLYKMPSAYADKMALVMRRATLGKLRALTGNPFMFQETPQGTGNVSNDGTLHGVPVYTTDEMPAMTTGQKSVLVINPDFYGVAEREGMTVVRNPYLYQATGQIGLFARFRLGGAVLQSEAAYYITQA